MSELYRDRYITCDERGLSIAFYYFPFGTKRIPYDKVRGIERVQLSAMRGNLRIWGTANPGYWASLDPRRPKKSEGLVLDLGGRVRPFITPDDPARVEALVREHAGLAGESGGGASPII